MPDRPLGIATLHVLCAIRDGYRYGLQIVDRSGHPSGTVYPTLSRMEKRGFVKAHWERQSEADRAGRPRRRYYVLTPQGEAAIATSLEHYRRLTSLAGAETDFS